VTPHMCNVCWVNDHMYCYNMKRVTQYLSNSAGCIHCVACEHYQQAGTSQAGSSSLSLHWTNQPSCHAQVVSADDLLCEEDMIDSESETSNDSIDGTELLQVQLKARAEQIFRSLGVTELPTCTAVSTESQSTVLVSEDVDELIEPEEYAAELIVDADSECVQDSSDAVLGALVGSKQETDELRWTRDCDQQQAHCLSTSRCCLASFDGMSPREPSPSVNVKVHVHPVSENRVVIKYPKYHSSPSEYVHLDVTFPNGATDEVVNKYIRNDVARFICEKKPDLALDVPVSVTVVKDCKSSETTSEDCRSVSWSSVEPYHNGRHSALNTVSTISIVD